MRYVMIYHSQEQLEAKTRKELLQIHKELFGKGSRDKNKVIISKILQEYSELREKTQEQESAFVEVVAEKDIKQRFGLYLIQVKAGDRFKVPRYIYQYWQDGANHRKIKPPVRSVKAKMMADLRDRRSK